MARPTLFGHRKFRALARQLQSKALAVGTLELIWAVANDSGDAFLGSSEDVEDIADWRGEPGALTGLLVSCGFLDASGDRYLVHDHEHHCPQYVRRRRDREQKRRGGDASVTGQGRVNGDPLSSTPISHHPSPITPPPKEQEEEERPPAAPTRPPTLISRQNPRIVNPGAVVECWDFTFRDLKALAAPKWPDESERYRGLLAWMTAVDDALRAAGTIPKQPGKEFWPARFRAEFGSDAAPEASAEGAIAILERRESERAARRAAMLR